MSPQNIQIHSPKLMVYTENFLPYSESFIVRQSLKLQYFNIEYKCRRDIRTSEFSEFKIGQIVKRNIFNKLLFSVTGISSTFKKEINTFEIALVHHGVNVWRFCKNFGNSNVQLFVVCHGSDVFRKKHIWHGYTNWQFNRKINWISKHVKTYIAVSHAVEKSLIQKGISADKVEVRYIGTECQANESDRKEVDLVFVGRLEKNKGPLLLLEALEFVDRPVSLAIIGTGKLKKKIQKKVSKLELHSINFLGTLNQASVIQELRRARICVIPSLTTSSGIGEGLSMVAIESLSVGTPILVSSCGGLPETVSYGGGVIFQEGNPRSLANSIIRLLESEEILKILKEEAISAQRKYFCIEKNTADLSKKLSRNDS